MHVKYLSTFTCILNQYYNLDFSKFLNRSFFYKFRLITPAIVHRILAKSPDSGIISKANNYNLLTCDVKNIFKINKKHLHFLSYKI